MNFERKWLMFLLIWAGILIGFFCLVLIPGGERLENLREENRGLESQVLTLERKVRDLEELKKRLTDLRSIISFLEARLPTEEEVSNLLLMVEDAALRSQVEIQSLVPQPLATQKEADELKNYYLEASFKSTFLTDYYGLLSFFNHLRSSSRLIQVSQFDVQEDQTGLLSVEMELSTYYMFPRMEVR